MDRGSLEYRPFLVEPSSLTVKSVVTLLSNELSGTFTSTLFHFDVSFPYSTTLLTVLLGWFLGHEVSGLKDCLCVCTLVGGCAG